MRAFAGSLLFAAALLALSGAAQATEYRWNVNANGNWNAAGNWALVTGPAAAGGFPNGIDHVATFNSVGNANRTVTIPTGVTITVGQLKFDDNNRYTIARAGTGALVFDTAAGSAGILVTNVNGNGAHVISTPFTLNDPLVITQDTTGNFTIGNAIAGAGMSLTKDGTGNLTFSSGVANTYSGSTTVNAGTLILSQTVANAIAGNLVIGAAAGTVRLTADDQIVDTASVTITGGVFTLNNGVAETIGALNMTGGSVTTNTGTLTLGGNLTTSQAAAAATVSGRLSLGGGNRIFDIADGAAATDLSIAAVISTAGVLTKSGAGTLVLSGNNTYSGGTVINAGTLLANNAAGSGTGTGTVSVATGATLGGTGTLSGAISTASGGTLAPGAGGPESLNVGNVAWASGGIFAVELNSNVAATGYDQLISSNIVNLNSDAGAGSTLAISTGFTPAAADAFTIINKTSAGAISGTFNGLAEGAVILMASQAFDISYVGGNGNDVVLRPRPRVVGVNSTTADGSYITGAAIVVTVRFSLPVVVTGTPQLTLETGASDAVVNYSSGSGTDTLSFNYIVAGGQSTPDLDCISSAALALNGGTIQSSTGRNAILTLPAPGAASSLGANRNIAIVDLTILARETVDTDGNGKLDAIRITADAPLTDDFTSLSITVAGYTLAAAPYDTGATPNDGIFFVRLVEQSLPPFTGDTAATPAVQVLAGGNLLLHPDAGSAAADKARPALLKADWQDSGSFAGVGWDDSIDLTFSEPVLAAGVLLADIGLPVLGDGLDASAIADQGPSTLVGILLKGTPALTPGGTYSSGALSAGSPTGVYIANGARISDQAAVPNTALNQGVSSALDLLPGTALVSVWWSDDPTCTVGQKDWALGNIWFGNSYKYSVTNAPMLLMVRNAGNVRVDFSISCAAASTPNGWQLAAAPALDKFALKVDASTPLDGVFEYDLSTGAQPLATAVYSGREKQFDVQFSAPTDISANPGAVESVTVTLTATQN